MNGASEGNRNTQLTKLAYDLAGNGIAQSTAKNILLEAASKCSPSYPEHEIKAIIKSAYKETRTPARSYYGENITRAKTWQAAAEFVESFNWNSRKWTYETKKKNGKAITETMKAYTVKRVFLALIERAKMDGRPTFRATIRETSVITSLQKLTVCHALQALARAEFVRPATASDGSGLFSFADYSTFDTLTITCRNSVSNLEVSKLPKTHAEKDVFGTGHLYTVWRHLLVSPERNPYQTAKALQLTPSVVYSAFSKLQDMTLVTYSKSEGLYYGETRTDNALQILAVETGKDGRSRTREAKYQQERQRYLNNEFRLAKARYALETQRLMKKKVKV
jgi:Fe2+ or Zn2+ uptake regulation protein